MAHLPGRDIAAGQHDLAGEWDYLVMLVTHGMPRCREVVDGLFLGAPNVKRYDTHFIFDVVKAGLRIPLRDVESPRAARAARDRK